MADPQAFILLEDVDGVVVDVPRDTDVSAIGRMQLLSWHQTYPSAEHGIDEQWIDEQMTSRTSPAADGFRRGLLAAQRANPDGTLYRVARDGTEVVGFVLASRSASISSNAGAAGRGGGSDEPGIDDATLEALYVLSDHQGTGLADRLMAAVLQWLGGQAMQLEVASYNARAIRFYQRHGFHLTGETAIFRGRIPIVAMRRLEQR